MLAHPFHAPSAKEADDMEKQAVGRINRVGQQASSLVLWRVVTEQTIEEELYQKRLAEMEQQRAPKRSRRQ
jgi:hypothetical protein